MRITFRVIKRCAERRGKCPICNGRVVRRTTFEGSVNPFDGLSPQQVYDYLNREALDWKPDFTHAKCKQAQR